ncbi:hypothetical protein SAMN02745831_04208 [Streptomyces sp. PgraA7]|uniref:hypothetical protein n=1 Tax=Streptomyces rubiginosohelvolus TaxID=67362 RepID=UPI000B7195C5|nr:hypothetical protein SAMN02745831_04208 [Streptomyces sp. PgraA7]
MLTVDQALALLTGWSDGTRAVGPTGPVRTHHFPETPLPQYLTVGHLLRQLQDLDPNLPVRLAVNPDFPFTHYVGTEVVVQDGRAFIPDDGQEDYLPTSARNALNWS